MIDRNAKVLGIISAGGSVEDAINAADGAGAFSKMVDQINTARQQADALIAWRGENGFSQIGLAMALGVDHSTVWRWEQGKVAIPPFLHLALKGLVAAPDSNQPRLAVNQTANT